MIAHYDAPWVAILTALLVWLALSTDTGQDLPSTTPAFLVCTVLAALLGGAAVLSRRTTARPWGLATAVAAIAVVLVTGASITWSVSPSTSWVETNRVLASLAVLLGGIAAARLAPRRWAVLPTSMLLATTIILTIGLVGKVFPGTFEPEELFARLQQPLGYWNAVGALAAMNLVLALWFGTREHGYRPLNAVAYPVAAISVAALLMSYSRGALLAAAIGVIAWVIFSPRRLHSLLVLGVGGGAGLFVGVWAFANTALSTDNVILAARESSGVQLGVLLLATLVLLLLIGLALEFSLVFTGIGRHERRRFGALILCLAALVPIAGVGALATSERGIGGSVEHAWNQLTNPEATGPSSDPTRLGAIGSQRGLYWSQAFLLYRAQPVHGVGAGGFAAVQDRARGLNPTIVKHAHGWVPQTLADGGWITLGLQSLFGLTWLLAALRALGFWGPLRGRRSGPEHNATAAMVSVVGVFAVTAVVDWSWFIPALTVPVALFAGWVAGRGPERGYETDEPEPLAPRTREWWTTRGPVLALLVVATVGAVVSIAQPWRAERLQDEALVALDEGDLRRAEDLAHRSAGVNPLSPRAIYALAQVRVAEGKLPEARALYRDAVRLEPAVTTGWQRWAEFELRVANDPKEALRLTGIALKLAPTSQAALRTALAAQRELEAAAAPAGDQSVDAPAAGKDAATP